jgi:predicted small metal-binding protein
MSDTNIPDTKHEHSHRRIACHDVVAGCGFTASAETEDELMAQVVAHAKHEHGVTEVTPELAAKVKAAIRQD